MMYFEKLRASLVFRPENGRCGIQVKWGTEGHRRELKYFCPKHWKLIWTSTDISVYWPLADGETMGCDYETSV